MFHDDFLKDGLLYCDGEKEEEGFLFSRMLMLENTLYFPTPLLNNELFIVFFSCLWTWVIKVFPKCIQDTHYYFVYRIKGNRHRQQKYVDLKF